MIHEIITIPATLQSVSRFTDDLHTMLADHLDVKPLTEIVLAVQELCVNIVKHAYAGTSGDIQIQIDWSNDLLQMVFDDQAPHAYNTAQAITPPDPLGLPERGMGLYVIHQVFEEVVYTRLQVGNQWRLTKKLRTTL